MKLTDYGVATFRQSEDELLAGWQYLRLRHLPDQYLHQSGWLHLLPHFYSRSSCLVLWSMSSSRQECGCLFPRVMTLPWIEIRAIQETPALSFSPDLGPGEAEVLVLGLEAGPLLLLDDALARRHADLFRSANGTLRVLAASQRRGLGELGPVLLRLEGCSA
jgi:predicted nucleic acid-binding protein